MQSGRTRRGFLGLVGGVAGASVTRSADAQAGATRLAVYFARGSVSFEAAEQFCAMATAAAGSARTVEPDEGSDFMPPLKTIGRSSRMAFYYAPAANEPLFRLSVLPMLTSSLEEAETLLRIARPYYNAVLARHDQVLLAAQPWRPGTLWSRRAIRSAADVAGRAFGLGGPHTTDGWGGPLERLGARFAPASAELVLVAGKSGAQYAPIHKNVAEVFVAAQLDFLTANREFLASLPDAHRQVLLAAARVWEAARWRFVRELIQLDHDDAAAAGVTIVTEPPKALVEALRTAAEPDIRSWMTSAGDDGAKIIADYRHAIGRG
jgi:hypothetical protein